MNSGNFSKLAFVLSALISLSSEAKVSTINGYFDHLIEESGTWSLRGWACALTKNSALKVEVYLEEDTQKKNLLGSSLANMKNDAPVDLACQTKGSPHRFLIDLKSAGKNNTGKTLSVYAIDGTNVVKLPPNPNLVFGKK